MLLAAPHSAIQELDLDYCRERGIAPQRRVTGGPALYIDERQLLWELYLHRRETGGASLHALARRICHAAAAALTALGLDARLRDRSQIEIDGRTVCEGGFAVERNAILFQARLLLDAEAASALGVLRTPWSSDAAALAEEAGRRVTSLAAAAGRALDVREVKAKLVEAFESEFGTEFGDADLGLSEHARCEAALPAIDTPDWLDHTAAPAGDVPLLAAVHRAAAGDLAASVMYERASETIRRTWFTRGPRFEPPRLQADLEAALADVPLARIDSRIESFFGSRPVEARGFTAADFTSVVKRAVRQPLLAGNS